MTIISIEELVKETVVNRQVRKSVCPIKDCASIGCYAVCYSGNYHSCPIFDVKYQFLNEDQRRILK